MEQRLKFLTGSGEIEKNTDVMDEVLTELKGEGLYFESERQLNKKQKKAKKARAKIEAEEQEEENQQATRKRKRSK